MPLGVPQPAWLHTQRRVFGSGQALHQAHLEYSDTNEDLATSLRTLAIQPGNVVIGVTGSADLLLLALQHDPAFVAGYDVNPAQNALAELKRHAIAKLSYDEYLALMGYRPSHQRQRLLSVVLDALTDEVRSFWERHDMCEAIEAGLWRQGTATRKDLASWKAALDQLEARIGPQALRIVLGLEGTAQDRARIRTRVARTDPKYAEPAIRNNNHFKFDAFRYAAGMSSEPAVARYASSFLPSDCARPPISEDEFGRIRHRIHRLSFQTLSIGEAFAQMPPDAFDRAYLSNVTEYLTLAQERELVNALLWKARPDAVVVLLYLALSPAQQRDLLDHRMWSERGLARLLRASQWKERFENERPDRSDVEAWLRDLGRTIDRVSHGGAAQTVARTRKRLLALDRATVAQKASVGARRSLERLRDYDYAKAGRRAARSLQTAWQEAQDRVAEVRQLDDEDHVLIENEAHTAALFSDVYANLRATYASRSFYGFDYAILHKVPRSGATYVLPKRSG